MNRRSPKRPAKRKNLTNRPKPIVTPDTETTGRSVETDLDDFWSSDRGRTLKTILVTVCTSLGGIFFRRDIVCPGQLDGIPRYVTAVIVGAPAGIAFAVLCALGVLIIQRGKLRAVFNPLLATISGRAALGAIFGTLLAISAATIALGHEPPKRCHVDFLQTIGNGAAWGTLLGFASSIGILLKFLVRVEVSDHGVDTGHIKFVYVATFLIAVNLVIAIPVLLMKSQGWPD